MKKIILLFLVFVSHLSFGQTYDVNLAADMLGGFKGLKKGQKVVIAKMTHDFDGDTYGNIENTYYLIVDNKRFPVSKNMGKKFKFIVNNPQDLWNAEILKHVVCDLEERGLQKDIRGKLEKDVVKYLQQVKANKLEFKDPFLENYINSILAKIVPLRFIDARPGIVNLLILNDPSLNAAIYPNGTLVINTGMLAVLQTEGELAAILAREVAHFVLDHAMLNYLEDYKKDKGNFWNEVQEELSAKKNGDASHNTYYVPGAAPWGLVVQSAAVASQLIVHLGMDYSHEQESEADMLAREALKLMGYDKNSLATAFSRIEKAMLREGNSAMYFSAYTRPDLNKRIYACGYPQIASSKEFQNVISSAVTSTARLKFEDNRFAECLHLVDQNIRAGVAVPMDYVLKANCLLSLYKTDEMACNAQKMVELADKLDPKNINVDKAEIMVCLRMKDKSRAMFLLKRYVSHLNELKRTTVSLQGNEPMSELSKFLNHESEWAKNMSIKIKGM